MEQHRARPFRLGRPAGGAMMRVLAVVVLYGKPAGASKTLAGMASAFAADHSLAQQLDILIWDNSSELAQPSLPFPFTYQHPETNEGVSGAYNGAASIAGKRGVEWLLLSMTIRR